jgi:hypothetical protein
MFTIIGGGEGRGIEEGKAEKEKDPGHNCRQEIRSLDVYDQ